MNSVSPPSMFFESSSRVQGLMLLILSAGEMYTENVRQAGLYVLYGLIMTSIWHGVTSYR